MEERMEAGSFTPVNRNRSEMDREVRLEEEVEEVEHKAAEKLRAARRRLSDAYDRTAQVANRAYSQTIDYARDNPGITALVTFGAGIGIGMLLAGGDRGYARYRGRIVPALATAAAEAVLEVF